VRIRVYRVRRRDHDDGNVCTHSLEHTYVEGRATNQDVGSSRYELRRKRCQLLLNQRLGRPVSADRQLNPPTPSASPARLLAQPTCSPRFRRTAALFFASIPRRTRRPTPKKSRGSARSNLVPPHDRHAHRARAATRGSHFVSSPPRIDLSFGFGRQGRQVGDDASHIRRQDRELHRAISREAASSPPLRSCYPSQAAPRG
jgi:hypothetical protein